MRMGRKYGEEVRGGSAVEEVREGSAVEKYRGKVRVRSTARSGLRREKKVKRGLHGGVQKKASGRVWVEGVFSLSA